MTTATKAPARARRPRPLIVLCWLWQQPGGRYEYTAEHVNIWAAMVRRNLSMPHQIACVTDTPGGIDRGIRIIRPPRDFEGVRIPTWGDDKPQCLRRLSMFRPDAARIFGPRFVSMDIDCVISAPLDPLFDRPEDIVLYRGTHLRRPYNGSMMLMTAGARPRVFTEFTPEGAVTAGQRFVGSDQAWISHCLGAGEAVWTAEDGVHAFSSTKNVGDPRVTFFLGPPKPWEIAASDPNSWVARQYRKDRDGQCLILGSGPTIWHDLAQALPRGPFEAVIASPEAARQWPGRIDAIATSDADARDKANALGFSRVTLCGATPA